MFDDLTQEALRQPFPASAIKQRKIRGGMLVDYVEAATLIARLNDVFGHAWSFTVTNRWREDNECFIQGVLTASGISHEAVGAGEIATNRETGDILSIGDAYKGAVSDCLKLCAKQLGIGLHLWGYETGDDNGQTNTPVEVAPTGDSMTGLQRQALEKIAERVRGDNDVRGLAVLVKALDPQSGMTKAQASDLITQYGRKKS